MALILNCEPVRPNHSHGLPVSIGVPKQTLFRHFIDKFGNVFRVLVRYRIVMPDFARGMRGNQESAQFMISWSDGRLSPEQSALVKENLPGSKLMADLGWGLIDTNVFHVGTPAGEFIIKASGPHNHHLVREINAHLSVVPALAAVGLAPHICFHSREQSLLITEYLPGKIAVGTLAESEPDVHSQAGNILAKIHEQSEKLDTLYEARQIEKARGWLEQPHRIDPDTAERLREILNAYRPHPVSWTDRWVGRVMPARPRSAAASP